MTRPVMHLPGLFLRISALSILCALAPLADSRADLPLREQLELRLKDMQCPGGLVGIFRSDGTSQKLAVGLADLDSGKPMQADMHMRIGSITKLFVGTVVLQLADEGKVSLDDTVAKYVRGVPAGEKITLRQLGNHTSGLYNSIQDRKFQYAIMDAPEKDWTADEILAVAFAYDAYFPPGTRFRYSNTNTIVLGQVIKKVTGQTWQEAVHERILEALGLKYTGVPGKRGVLPDPHPSAYRNSDGKRIIGYGDTFTNVSHYSASNTDAAGNLYSTVDDLGRAIGPLASGELLKPQGSRRELHRWVSMGIGRGNYGFCITEMLGGTGHHGDVPGFNATAVHLPELNCSVVALTNLSNNADGSMPAEELVKTTIAWLRRTKDGQK